MWEKEAFIQQNDNTDHYEETPENNQNPWKKEVIDEAKKQIEKTKKIQQVEEYYELAIASVEYFWDYWVAETSSWSSIIIDMEHLSLIADTNWDAEFQFEKQNDAIMSFLWNDWKILLFDQNSNDFLRFLWAPVLAEKIQKSKSNETIMFVVDWIINKYDISSKKIITMGNDDNESLWLFAKK